MFGQLSYLVYLLTFTLIPTVLVWMWQFQFLKKNIKVIFLTTLAALLYQLLVDPVAEKWQAWFFSGDKILGFWLINFPIENSLFFILTSLAVSSATLALLSLRKN